MCTLKEKRYPFSFVVFSHRLSTSARTTKTITSNDSPTPPDTLQIIFSSGKSVAAIAMAMLVDRGLVSYQDKISKHWPEFAQKGKENIKIEDLMRHEAGFFFFFLQKKGLYDFAVEEHEIQRDQIKKKCHREIHRRTRTLLASPHPPSIPLPLTWPHHQRNPPPRWPTKKNHWGIHWARDSYPARSRFLRGTPARKNPINLGHILTILSMGFITGNITTQTYEKNQFYLRNLF